MKKVLILFFGWLLLINIFAVLVVNRVSVKSDTAYGWINPANTAQEQTWNSAPLHAKWDSFWYLDIAQNGYSYQKGDLSNIVFFPVYPLLIKLVSLFLGGNFALAGWIISSVALLFALVFFFKLIKEFHPQVDPYLPLLFLLIFPTAFFLNAVYTESLFLLLSIASFYYTFKKNYALAGVIGLLAALTRVTGILLIIPIVWEYIKEQKAQSKPLLNPGILWFALIPAGTFGFLLFHWIKFGNPFLFFVVEGTWGRTFTPNAEHFTFLTNPALANFILDALFVVFALGMTVFVFRKIRASYGLYMLATLGVALSTGTFMSIGRYLLVLFPLYIALASIKNEYFRYAWIFVSILLLSLYILLFTSFSWAG